MQFDDLERENGVRCPWFFAASIHGRFVDFSSVENCSLNPQTSPPISKYSSAHINESKVLHKTEVTYFLAQTFLLRER